MGTDLQLGVGALERRRPPRRPRIASRIRSAYVLVVTKDETSTPPLETPVFLAGTTRSGTTLLSLMLGHHPEIAFAGEFEWSLDPFAGGREPSLEALHERFETDRHRRWHDLAIDRALSKDELVTSFLAQMYAQEGGEARCLGATLHRNWRRALDLWPEARFIRLVRDGRDVAASWLRLGWEGNTYTSGVTWRALEREWDAARPLIPDAHIMELRFEDLIEAPEVELTRICDFLDLPYDPAMLEYHRHTTYDPVRPDQGQKWRRNLSDWQVRVFESVASDVLIERGYEPSGLSPVPIVPPVRLGLTLDAKVRQNAARMRFFGPGLWLADHVARRLPVPTSLRARLEIELNEITNRSLK